MKRVLIIAGGLLLAFAWQAQAQENQQQDTTAQDQAAVADSVGGQPATTSMSGGPAVPRGLTRADVYQQLMQSQKNGEADRMNELFKGN